MPNLYSLIRPALFAFDAEKTHDLVSSFSRFVVSVPLISELVSHCLSVSSPRLTSSVCGINIKTPIGLAAGFDKNGLMLKVIESLGFGFMEVGSITNLPSSGNVKPRMFRLVEDEALINRLGLNNHGPSEVRKNLLKSPSELPYLVNIAKTNNSEILEDQAIEDIVNCFSKMYDCGRAIVLNLSCPNTKDGKTFEDVQGLRDLLSAIRNKQKEKLLCGSKEKPLLIKLSSDLEHSQLEQLVGVGEEFLIDGYVLVNTSMQRGGLKTSNLKLAQIGRGGLSGMPLQAIARDKISFVYSLLKGQREIIGVGGVNSVESAYSLVRAGASAIELYTGLIYQGPTLVRDIGRGLISFLERDGFSNIKEAVGADVK